MGLPNHIGIVSLSKAIKPSDLSQVAAAIQKQVSRDFAPLWDVDATVDDFAQLKDLPLDYWPVILVDDDDRIPASATGVHLDKQGQPFALIRVTEGWGMTTSHEVLEMLADPSGNKKIAGDSPAQDQGRVEFLVEVCDPCEAADFGYTINGFLMSDFYTKQYFDPVKSAGVRYSFTGAITDPRQVLPGGYLSWRDPTVDEWFQLKFFGDAPEIVSLGKLTLAGSLRATIERISNAESAARMIKDKKLVAAAARNFDANVDPSSVARAKELMKQIEQILQPVPPESGEKVAPKLRKPPQKKVKDS
jgi:hypothetical protein